MGSKANSQQDPVHWPREITKAKLSQAKSFFIHIFLLKQWKKRGKGKFGQFLASLGKFGQVWASLGKFGQVWASLDKLGQGKWKRRCRKNMKRE